MEEKIINIYRKCAKLVDENLGKVDFSIMIHDTFFSIACWSPKSVPGEKLKLYGNYQFSELRTEQELEDIYNDLVRHIKVILL